MSFIHEDFLLSNKAAQRLYHEYAEQRTDSRLSLPSAARGTWPRTASSDNLFEIWLEGDHYKWRAMRANGVDERYCTGDASARGKIPRLGAHRAARLCAIRSTTGPTWS